MGKIETEARSVRRRQNIQKIVLHTVATAGILSVALLAPNALRMLSVLDGGRVRRKPPKFLIESAFEKLYDKRFIQIEKNDQGSFVRLTEAGKVNLAHMIATSPDTRKHKRWDKRWRMVMYNIREGRRGARIKIQRTLRTFGFYQLQASVWVYPYDCESLHIMLKADTKIGKDVLYAVVEKIENDAPIREFFELK